MYLLIIECIKLTLEDLEKKQRDLRDMMVEVDNFPKLVKVLLLNLIISLLQNMLKNL